MASLSTSTSFHQIFQSLKSEILAVLEKPEAPVSDIAKRLSDLKAQLSSVVSSLPAYDQRSYELQVRELETKAAAFRAKTRPKSKFAFSKSAAPPRADPAVSVTPSTVPLVNQAASSLGEEPTGASAVAGPSSLHRNVSGRKGDRILLSELNIPASSGESWTLSLEDLEDCDIDLRLAPGASFSPTGLSSLHARNLKKCQIYAGAIDGSAMLHDLEGCTFVAAVQQFRIHTSRHCDISLYIPSVPIIETCSDLVFRPHVPQTLDGTSAVDRPPNRVSEVADFSWIKPTRSPNWKYIDERIQDTSTG